MGKTNAALLSFNRGECSRYALARVDVERMRLSAEEQVNWQPWVLGPMMLRPGLQYIGGINDDLTCRLLPFIFSNSDVALLELTDSVLRVWTVTDTAETLVTRPSVSTVVTNGNFSSSTGWTLTATGSGSIASITAGSLVLQMPVAGGVARAQRTVTVSAPDQNVRHAFRIEVTSGPVLFKAGTTAGGGEYIAQSTLETSRSRESFHAIACSRAPDPRIRTFISPANCMTGREF